MKSSKVATTASAVFAAATLYIGQSALGEALVGPEWGEAAPSWTSVWWMWSALLFCVVLILGSGKHPLVIAASVAAWLVPTVLSGVLSSASLAEALNVAALSVMFAFTFHFSGWLAILLAAVTHLLQAQGNRR